MKMTKVQMQMTRPKVQAQQRTLVLRRQEEQALAGTPSLIEIPALV